MEKRTCGIDGCNDPIAARTWCSNHYKRWRKYGDPLGAVAPYPDICTFDGCGKPYYGRGYCAGHVAQIRRGVELRPLRSNGRGGGTCSECSEPVLARGWCRIHYRRWRKHGDPFKSAPSSPESPNGCTYPGCDRPYAYSGYCGRHARLASKGEELRPLEPHRKFIIDHHFFDVIDTEEKAYWLGFITADGCVYKTKLTINLQAADSPHLEKLAASLSSDYPVVPTGRSPLSGPLVRWSASSPQIVRALKDLGITPRKSATVVPWQGPTSLMRHYWRGMVDGDGGLTQFSMRRSAPKDQWKVYLSGSRPCVEAFAAWASAVCGSRAKATPTNPSQTCWWWAVGGNRMAPLVIRELYGDCAISLDRKQALADLALAR